jgi:hypothetical protein
MHFFLKKGVFSVKIALFSPKTTENWSLKYRKKEVSLSYETAKIYIHRHTFAAIFCGDLCSRAKKYAKISEYCSRLWAY